MRFETPSRSSDLFRCGLPIDAACLPGLWEKWEHQEPIPFPTVDERDTVDPGVT
jgi:hypothetical protein